MHSSAPRLLPTLSRLVDRPRARLDLWYQASFAQKSAVNSAPEPQIQVSDHVLADMPDETCNDLVYLLLAYNMRI